MPQLVARGCVQRECSAAVAIVGAYEQPSTEIDDRHLFDVAESLVLTLPYDLPGVLVERHDEVVARKRVHESLADGDATSRQVASGLRVFPFGDAGAAIDGDDVAECRLDADHTVDYNRRALIRAGGQ